jgi:isopentenyl-diphosphate Delta-isomerase
MPYFKRITLVDEDDYIVGYEDKMKVHKEGLLHRAFSIFVVNSQCQLLLQQRALNKYHSGGLWTNTCCSHAIKGEEFNITIHNRLNEEMGFDCQLHQLFKFRYQTTFDNGLIENELDYVFRGFYDGIPLPDPNEVSDWKWVDIDFLKEDIHLHPDLYTFWFKAAYDNFYQLIDKKLLL